MARATGTFSAPYNFESQIKWTLDARALVQSYNDLLLFTQNDYIPNGFTVSVFDADPDKRGVYQCINENDLVSENSWKKITGDVDTIFLPIKNSDQPFSSHGAWLLQKQIISSTSVNGTIKLSSTGLLTTYSFPHEQDYYIKDIVIQARSADARGNTYVTTDAENIYIHYEVAPKVGSENLEWSYIFTIDPTKPTASVGDDEAVYETGVFATGVFVE